jgi:hypothetical protein
MMCITDNPSWTDVLQAFAAAIGIPLTLFTLYKLVQRDRDRESEVKSLSTIAGQLVDMQAENEKRYKASRKPHLQIKLDVNYESKRVKIDFINSNVQSSIIKVSLSNDKYDFLDFNATLSSVTVNNGLQNFWIILSGKTKLFEYAVLKLDYTTEEGYEFIQDIIIWLQDGQYVYSPAAIIDKQNSQYE